VCAQRPKASERKNEPSAKSPEIETGSAQRPKASERKNGGQGRGLTDRRAGAQRPKASERKNAVVHEPLPLRTRVLNARRHRSGRTAPADSTSHASPPRVLNARRHRSGRTRIPS